MPNDPEVRYALCREKGITHLIYMGVHTQVCVLGKSVGVANLLKAGVAASHVITAVEVDLSGDGDCVRQSTARTPSDTPIVSATARTAGDGVRLALTGMDAYPVLVAPLDPTAGLAPISDFRGSADYRRTLAKVLAKRAASAVGGVT